MKLLVFLYKNYLKAAWAIRRRFKVKAYGIGFISTIIPEAYQFNFQGSNFVFLPSAGKNYGGKFVYLINN
ncbi:hypothetical protein [Crenothrix sp.]|uniref:hypothetical protein n=1 Tax=Crenothrix sp. TaxID=3100433 RepID=UPI00374D9CCF